MEPHRRIVLPDEHMRSLPLAVESVGINPYQERVMRPEGYPCFHWLQTISGRGELHYDGRTIALPDGTGVMLFPDVPHRYESASLVRWETAYLTFGGSAASGILSSLGIVESGTFHWTVESPVNGIVEGIVDRLESAGDVFGIETSAGAYRLLVSLMRYGTVYGKGSDPDRMDKLRIVVEWMESRVDDPSIGLEEIAGVHQLSNRALTAMFRESFGQSPYAYFIRLRIRKAKEMLVGSSPLSVRDIAERVGFRDASHFVATFRKHVGMTPEQFRKLH